MNIICIKNCFYNRPYFIRPIFFIVLCFLVTACAHRINITPDISEIEAPKLPRIKKNVGYYISSENLEKQVVTPGGGGDKVKYLPYKESEPVLKAMLSNIFVNVYQVPSLGDTKFIDSRDISYVFIPEITTNSSSRSIWIWPPSDFTVTLECKATDPSGEPLWQTKVDSEAHMGLPDVHKDFSLAGKVAITKAFSKLQHEIHVKFYNDKDNPEEYYSPQKSFNEEKDEYVSPQDQQSPKEPKSSVDSFDNRDEYYSPVQ